MCDPNGTNLINLNVNDDGPSISTVLNESIQPSKRNIWYNECLENNPFDHVQKQVNYVDDPFDIVEKEALLKACKPTDVKLGNLVALNDEYQLDETRIPETHFLAAAELGTLKLRELDSESPPVLFYEKQLVDTVDLTDIDGNPNRSSESYLSTKIKNVDNQRLLKLSISNAVHISPTARSQSTEFEDMLGTPVSSMLSRAAEFGEKLLFSESPLKFIEDEDKAKEALDFVNSEEKFQADLEMLKIPILNELQSTMVRDIFVPTESSVEAEITTNIENTLLNIEKIKAKLKPKTDDNQQEISSLIQDLKTLLSSGEVIDKSTTQKANYLLETLSTVLKPVSKEKTHSSLKVLKVIPQSIRRQSTFDLDLNDNNADNHSVQEMPNCMMSSSATYDEETPSEKHNLNLPEIDTLQSHISPHQCRYEYNNDWENSLKSDVTDVVDQLGKLLINNTDKTSTNKNPTVIFIMNANELNRRNQSVINANERSDFAVNFSENSINYGSKELVTSKHLPRRRSQSLTIHDKDNMVKLPLQNPIKGFIQKRKSQQWNKSPPITTTSPYGGKAMTELKTTPRIIRRNSYSSGTPFSAQIGVLRGSGSESKNHSQVRGTLTRSLDTQHEGQQEVIVRLIPVPSHNLPTFKPDLKKKFKHNTKSIVKSSGPLKATIPVKKVAPMLKTSPSTPESNTKANIFDKKPLQNQSKICKIPTTPLPSKERSTLGIGIDYPNACSTPAAYTSPQKRTVEPVRKSRYSYLSSTLTPKSSITNSIASSSLRRRTITEFKIQSPVKPRFSNSAGLAAASSSRRSTISSCLSTSAGARIFKTPVKPTILSTPSAKPKGRFSSRASGGSLVFSARNKENKRP